eukprot:5243756-Alexandrium_andersonii.AAC.1
MHGNQVPLAAPISDGWKHLRSRRTRVPKFGIWFPSRGRGGRGDSTPDGPNSPLRGLEPTNVADA